MVLITKSLAFQKSGSKQDKYKNSYTQKTKKISFFTEREKKNIKKPSKLKINRQRHGYNKNNASKQQNRKQT